MKLLIPLLFMRLKVRIVKIVIVKNYIFYLLLLDHVHRFVFTTTTSTFFIIEAFHDGNRSAHLTYRPLDLNTQNGLTRRMSVLLFGSPAADREM